MGNVSSHSTVSITPQTLFDFYTKDAVAKYLNISLKKNGEKNNDVLVTDFYNKSIEKIKQIVANKGNESINAKNTIKNVVEMLASDFENNYEYNNTFSEMDKDLNEVLNNLDILNSHDNILPITTPQVSTNKLPEIIKNEDCDELDIGSIITLLENLLKLQQKELLSDTIVYFYNQLLDELVGGKNTHQLIQTLSSIYFYTSQYSIIVLFVKAIYGNAALLNSISNFFSQVKQPTTSNPILSRFRLNSNSKIKSICYAKQTIYMLTSDLIIYKIRNEEIISNPIEKGETIFINATNDVLSIIAKDAVINLDKDLNCCNVTEFNGENVILACSMENSSNSFIYIQKVIDDKFIIQSNDSFWTKEISLNKDPIAVYYNNKKLSVIIEDDLGDLKNLTLLINSSSRILAMYQNTELIDNNVVAMDSEHYLINKSGRSYQEFLIVKRNRTFPYDIFMYENNGTDCISKLMNLLPGELNKPENHIVTQSELIYPLISIITEACNSGATPQTSSVVVHKCLTLLLMTVDDFPESIKIEDFINTLMLVTKSPLSTRQHIMSLILFAIDHNYNLISDHSDQIIEIFQYICKDSLRLNLLIYSIGILIHSPAIVYAVHYSDCLSKFKNDESCYYYNSVLYYGIKDSIKFSNDVLMTVVKWATNSKSNPLIRSIFSLALIKKFNAVRFIQVYLEAFKENLMTILKDDCTYKCTEEEDDNEFFEDELIRETPHPMNQRTNVRWEIYMPGADAIKIEFSEQCAVMLNEHDSLQVSNDTETIYSRNMYTEGNLPSVLVSNGPRVVVSLRQYCGTRVYGLRLKFKRIGGKPLRRNRVIVHFYVSYLIHLISSCCIDIFTNKNEDSNMIPCDFLLEHHMLDLKMTLTPKYVPQVFMNTMYSEVHSNMKANQDDLSIERAVISAVLWQLNLTNAALKKKSAVVIQPPTTPKTNLTPSRPNFKNTMNHIPQIKPLISPFVAQTPIRASVNPKTLAPLLQKKESESSELEEILKFIMREIYKLRSRLRYSKQKSENQTNFIYKIIEKANYFCGIRPVFDDTIPPTLDINKQRAANFIRLFGSSINLDEVISYTNEKIDQKNAQFQVASFIETFINESKSMDETLYLVIPFIKHLASSNVKYTKDVSKKIKNILEFAFSLNSDNAKLLTLLSNLNLCGDDENASEPFVKLLLQIDKTMLWKLSLISYFMGAPSSFFLHNTSILLKSGASQEVFLLYGLLNFDAEKSSLALSQAFQAIQTEGPNTIIAALGFITKTLCEFGIDKELKIQSQNQTTSIYDKMQDLIVDVGNYVMKRNIKCISKGLSKESYDVIIGEIVSMFRTILLDKRSSNDLLVLMDDVLYNTKLNMTHKAIVYGIYMIIGHGIYPLTTYYGINDKFEVPLKVTEYIPDAEFVSVLTPNGFHINIREDKIYGSPRVGFTPEMYPFTKFRLTTLMFAISLSAIDPILYSLAALTFSTLVQDKTWKVELRLAVDSTVINDAIGKTNEAYYHSMAELIQSAAATAEFTQEKLTHLIRINQHALIGNCPVSGRFYFEIIFNPEIDAIGILGDSATSEYTPMISFDFSDYSVSYNGVKSFCTDHEIKYGDRIGIGINDHNQVIIYHKGEFITSPMLFPFFYYVPYVQSTLDQEIILGKDFDIYHPEYYQKDIPLYDGVVFDSDEIDDDNYHNTVQSGFEHKNILSIKTPIFDGTTPYMFKRKVFTTSKVELNPVFEITIGQYCKINVKSPHYNKIGRIVGVDENCVVVKIIDPMESETGDLIYSKDFVTLFPTYIVKLNVKKEVFKVIGIRAMRLALLELGYVDQFKRYIDELVRLMIPSVVKAFGATRIEKPDVCKCVPITSNRHYAKCLVDMINKHMEILTKEREASHRDFYIESLLGTDNIWKDDNIKVIKFSHTSKAIGAKKWTWSGLTMFTFSDRGINVRGKNESFFIGSSKAKTSAFNGDSIEIRFSANPKYYYEHEFSVVFSPIFEYITSETNSKYLLNSTLSFCKFYSLLEKEVIFDKENIHHHPLIYEFALSWNDVTYLMGTPELRLAVQALYQLASNTPNNFCKYCFTGIELDNIEYVSSKGLENLAKTIVSQSAIDEKASDQRSLDRLLMMSTNVWNGLISYTQIYYVWKYYIINGKLEEFTFQDETSFTKEITTYYPDISVSYRYILNTTHDDVEFKINDIVIPPNTPITIHGQKMVVKMESKEGKVLPTTVLTYSIDRDPFDDVATTASKCLNKYPEIFDDYASTLIAKWGKSEIRDAVRRLNTEEEKSNLDVFKASFSVLLEELQDIPIKKYLHNPSMKPFILGCLHAFKPSIQSTIIDKIACYDMGFKPILHFSRTAAALMEENPRPSHACSLFDQLVKQVKISELKNMKARNAPFTVELAGEGAIDAGGPGRDLYSELCEEIFKEFNHLFVETSNKLYAPDPRSEPARFVYAGALVGLAFITKNPQPFQFDIMVWKFLIGQSLAIKDILNSDEAFSRLYSSDDSQTMVCPSLSGEQHELVPGGGSITAPAEEWRRAAEKFRLSEIELQMKALRHGFEIIMKRTCRWLTDPEQIHLLICGPTEIDAEAIIRCLNFSDCSDEVTSFFPECIRKLTSKERSQLLKFITGRVALPVDSEKIGFHIKVTMVEPGKWPYLLPVAATCASTITIPNYPSEGTMLERLRTALSLGSEMIMDGQFNAADRTT